MKLKEKLCESKNKLCLILSPGQMNPDENKENLSQINDDTPIIEITEDEICDSQNQSIGHFTQRPMLNHIKPNIGDDPNSEENNENTIDLYAPPEDLQFLLYQKSFI